jgi:hypothetical protein
MPDGESHKIGVSHSAPAPAEKARELFPEHEIPREALPLLRRAGIGRAKGAGNRRTQAMRELYLRMGYVHPMLWLGEILSRPVTELAKELHCKAVEALAEQRKAAADLLPYLESRMPLQIHDDRERSPNVLIVGDVRAAVGEARRARAEGAMSIDDDVLEAVALHVQNQGLTTSGAAAVAQTAVAREAQALDDAAKTGTTAADTKSAAAPPGELDLEPRRQAFERGAPPGETGG